jgi:hypothetical protein
MDCLGLSDFGPGLIDDAQAIDPDFRASQLCTALSRVDEVHQGFRNRESEILEGDMVLEYRCIFSILCMIRDRDAEGLIMAH